MTLHPDDCMSMLELTEIKAIRFADGEARAHLLECPRCRLLLWSLNPGVQDDVFTAVRSAEHTALTAAPRPASEATGAPRTGDIYLADAETGHAREVVVVIGQAPQRDDVFVVAPTSTDLDEAADMDLTVDESPLGYRHLVSVWAQGQVFSDQLAEFVGRLGRTDREHLIRLFNGTRSGHDEAPLAVVGHPLQGADDPRRTHQALMLDRLKRLYAPVDRALATLDAHRPLPAAGQTVGELVAARFGEAWDFSSLVAVSRVARADLDRILRDELDLTDRTDVVWVAAVLRALEIPAEDAEDPVRWTLEFIPGGERVATGGASRMAARSYADVDEATRSRDLYRNQSEIDSSPEARRRAIDRYWTELVEELEETPAS